MFPISGAPFWHVLLETLGIVLAYRYYTQLRQQTSATDPINQQHRFYLLLAAAFGAFVGSRLLGSLESPTLFFSGGGSIGWTYYLRAKTIVGGLLGGLFGVEGIKRYLHIQHRSGDVYVYPLLLAMMIGRVGCFLMGIQESTYGLPTSSSWGIDLGDGLLRHPTALYEIIFLGSCWLSLLAVEHRHTLPNGWRFMLFMVAYLCYRFAIGFLQPAVLFYGLSTIQWACLVGLSWYSYDYGYKNWKQYKMDT